MLHPSAKPKQREQTQKFYATTRKVFFIRILILMEKEEITTTTSPSTFEWIAFLLIIFFHRCRLFRCSLLSYSLSVSAVFEGFSTKKKR